MKYFFTVLLSLLLATLPVKANVEEFNAYVAVISSRNIAWFFEDYPKYKTDAFIELSQWDNLPLALQYISKHAGNNPIFLDFMVHGDPGGLYVDNNSDDGYDRASMGYILNNINKYLKDKKITIHFESCYAAAAYRNTIRGAKPRCDLDNIEDLNYMPLTPVYGIGDGFSGSGPWMYLQTKYHFKKWWVDLRDWDPLGKNKPLAFPERKGEKSDFSPTTELMWLMWQIFSDHIP